MAGTVSFSFTALINVSEVGATNQLIKFCTFYVASLLVAVRVTKIFTL